MREFEYMERQLALFDKYHLLDLAGFGKANQLVKWLVNTNE